MPVPSVLTKQRYKVVVLGPPAVGKTALVRRLVDGSFVEGARQRGLDFYTCHITLRDDVAVALQLWDLSDCPCRPEDDAAPLAAYIFNSQAVLFVYDVSCPESLESLRHALLAVEAAATAPGAAARPYLALVANKCDLQWASSEALARELAARYGCVRYTLSARSGHGVSRAAVQLACDLAGVPLAAATEHAGRFLDPPEPDGLPTGPVTCAASTGAGTGNTPAEARQPSGGMTIASAVAVLEACSAGPGKFQVRAPAYQTGPVQGSSRGSLDEQGLYGLGPYGAGGGCGVNGGGDEPWRPISRSTTSSRAVTVIGKTDSLGQRNRSTSPPLLQQQGVLQPGLAKGAAGELGPQIRAAGQVVGDDTHSDSHSQRSGAALAGGQPHGHQGGWRRLLCCLPARQRQ